MANYKVTDAELTGIANAIRTKGGTESQLEFPDGFSSAIANLPSQSTLGTKSITQNGTYDAEDDSLDGYSEVTVNVPDTEYVGYIDCTSNPGAVITATDGTHTYTATADSNGSATLRILEAGTYSVTASYNGSTSEAETIVISSNRQTFSHTFGPVIVSWASGTDAQIAAMVAALDAGTLTIAETGWEIGDEREVQLSAMEATGVEESHAAQTVTFVLMDSQHYNLVGGGKDHFVVGMKGCLSEDGYVERPASTSSTWSASKRRTWCNEVFRNAIPETLRACFKQFNVVSASNSKSGTTTTSDYFSLFGGKEISNSASYSAPGEAGASTQIAYYATSGNRIKGKNYWTRTLRADNAEMFVYIHTNGSPFGDYSSVNKGISPFGCI